LVAREEDAAAWEQRSTARALDAARKRTLRRSRRLVDAATEILRREGVDGLTVQAVVERAGLSLRAFYQRFAGKDELLLAVFEETMRDAAVHLRAEIAPFSDPLERLRVLVTGIFLRSHSADVLAQSVPLSHEHLRLAEARPAELRHAIEPLIALLAEQVETGMRAGVVREGDPRRLAVLIHHLVAGQIHGVLLGTVTEDDAERSGEELWQFCLRAIRADSLPPSPATAARAS
jgi:AcrR family transcriptional regulator